MRILLIITLLICFSCGSVKKTQQAENIKEKMTVPSEKEVKVIAKTEGEIETKNEGEKKTIAHPEDTIAKVKVEKTSKEIPSVKKEIPRISFDHTPLNTILQTHVSAQGNVDYKRIKNEWNELRNYIASLGENMPTDHWSKEEKLAYWINAYNALTIDLILRHYPISSIKDIDKPWKQRFWKLGDKWYNLDEIEHKIIRKMGEPRIHFVLVCAAVSCPKLYNKAFTAKNLETSLDKLTREFLADTSKNHLAVNSIEISKIFQWFAKDFKQDGSLIAFLNKHTDVHISSSAKKRFKDYNWALNE